jgi:hypothetical protein
MYVHACTLSHAYILSRARLESSTRLTVKPLLYFQSFMLCVAWPTIHIFMSERVSHRLMIHYIHLLRCLIQHSVVNMLHHITRACNNIPLHHTCMQQHPVAPHVHAISSRCTTRACINMPLHHKRMQQHPVAPHVHATTSLTLFMMVLLQLESDDDVVVSDIDEDDDDMV